MLLIKILKCCDIDKILPNVIYNFGNSDINIEGVKSSSTEQLLTTLRI